MTLNPISLRLSDFDAALVDLDGTLVDTLDDFVAALNLTLADVRRPSVTREQVRPWIGKGAEYLLKMALVPVKYAQADTNKIAFLSKNNTNNALKSNLNVNFDLVLASYQRHYKTVNGQHSTVYPGAKQGLQHLQQLKTRNGSDRFKLACLTNKPTAFAIDLLRAKGLLAFFDSVVGGDAFARKKPDPMPILKTCEALATLPARTLMIGDSANDAQAARAAGSPVLLVTYGYNHGEPIRQVDADGWLDSLAELGAF